MTVPHRGIINTRRTERPLEGWVDFYSLGVLENWGGTEQNHVLTPVWWARLLKYDLESSLSPLSRLWYHVIVD
ncbi:hypothetical protein TNCV_3213971 [Trichonephila clavipes]|nr:hypothetical protein TNCV_3213971 [Trichonephila clavipes]